MTFDPKAAAEQLLEAHRSGKPAASLDPVPANTGAAYAVQSAVLRGLGDPGGVWKMALLDGVQRETSILPRAFLHEDGSVLSLSGLTQIEVETALVLADDPAAVGPEAAIAEVHLAFEFVASRYAHDPKPLEKMADAFNSAAIVIGERIAGWRSGLPDRLGIALSLDGKTIEAAEASAPMNEARDFLTWLSGHAKAQGTPLKQGDVVITGARLGPLPLGAAKEAHATAKGANVNATLR